MPSVAQLGAGWATVSVQVPETALVPPLVPGVDRKVVGYTPFSVALGVSATGQVRMYSSVRPEPEVDWVQAGELDVEVASVACEGRVPELRVIDAG